MNFDPYPDTSGFVPDEPAPFLENGVLPFSWEDDYNKLIGVQPNNDPSSPSPSNEEILKNINYDPPSGLDAGMGAYPSTGNIGTLPSSLTSSINQLLGTNFTGAQLARMAAVAGGGIAGLTGAFKPNVIKSGYQGSIPKYDAVRNMVNAPPTKAQGYRPGQGGINYGGDVSYVPKGTGLAAAPVVPTGEVKAAQGGLMGLAKGRYLQGETDGMADKIPAQIGQDQPAALSHGEFVVPADVVSHLGNGNSDAGAKKLYGMMDKIRQARTGTKKQGKEINPDKFMPGGEVKKLAGGGDMSTTGVGSAVAAGVTGQEQAPNTFAGEYIGDMLGKTQALSNAPYQQYMGPLTAGESGLQSKVFGGLQNINFPSNFGQSFSSTGAYTPPQMNMGAYQQRPIGTGQPGMTLNQGSNGFGDFGGQPSHEPASQAMIDAQNARNAALPQNEDYFTWGVPGSSTFGTTQGLQNQGPAQPGQMPPSGMGGLAGLAGRMPQQPQQQPPGIAAQYMNPYLQSVLDPQMAELRRQNDITNMMSNAKMTSAGAFGGGRQAIMNAENNRNLMQEMNKTVGQGYATAFDKAQNQFNTEQGQGLGLANLMANQGTTQRNIESEGIAADKAAFEEARLNPYKMLQFQQSMLNGMPISATNYNIAQPSGLTSLAQGATTVNTLLKNLGLGT